MKIKGLKRPEVGYNAWEGFVCSLRPLLLVSGDSFVQLGPAHVGGTHGQDHRLMLPIEVLMPKGQHCCHSRQKEWGC